MLVLFGISFFVRKNRRCDAISESVSVLVAAAAGEIGRECTRRNESIRCLLPRHALLSVLILLFVVFFDVVGVFTKNKDSGCF